MISRSSASKTCKSSVEELQSRGNQRAVRDETAWTSEYIAMQRRGVMQRCWKKYTARKPSVCGS